MQVEQTGKEMTWSTRAGQKGGTQDRGPEQGSPEQESRTGMSKPVTSWLKKKTRTRKSLGRGSRRQKGTIAGRTGIQNRDVQTSEEEDKDKEVSGQGQ